MTGFCSAFWACLNGTAVASCCPTNSRAYVQGVGCTTDPSCLSECPPKDNRIVSPTGKYLSFSSLFFFLPFLFANVLNYIIKIKLPLYAKCRFVIAKLWICAFGVTYFIGGMFNIKK